MVDHDVDVDTNPDFMSGEEVQSGFRDGGLGKRKAEGQPGFQAIRILFDYFFRAS